jgi:hypothetical protein
MLKTLILICATAMPRADCSIDTAAAVVQGPDAASLMECGLHGQAYLAGTALTGYLADGHYLKISCGGDPRARRVAPAPGLRTAAQPTIR